MKGICHIWSRGRHFSPSLPDRGPTQVRGPTGIWNLAHSIIPLFIRSVVICKMIHPSSSNPTTTFTTSYSNGLVIVRWLTQRDFSILSFPWEKKSVHRSPFRSCKGQAYIFRKQLNTVSLGIQELQLKRKVCSSSKNTQILVKFLKRRVFSWWGIILPRGTHAQESV